MTRTLRVLHLLGMSSDFQTERLANSLWRGLGPGFEVTQRAIGRGGAYRDPLSAALGLRQLRGTFDLIHAWDTTSLIIAATVLDTPVLFSPMSFIGRRGLALPRAAVASRNIQVVCPSATQRRVCVEAGLALAQCHLIYPGVDFSRVRPRRRDPAIRRALGLGDSDYVMLAAGESTRQAAHERAVWAASILGVLSPRGKVLLWGRGPRAARAERLGVQLGQPVLVRSAERRLRRSVQFEELLPAADAVLVSASGPVATLPIAICMAAAVPIVSTVTYTAAELLEDRHTALMCPKDDARLLARRVLDLQEDSQLQWSISDKARSEAFELFPLTKFLAQYRAVYRQMVEGEPVVIT